MSIPIENIYYLLCYAWGFLKDKSAASLSAEKASTPQDLIALLLSEFVARLIRKGLDREYLSYSEALSGVRGRIDIATTARQLLRMNGLVQCEYDELSVDVPQNQIIRSTLRRLLNSGNLSSVSIQRLQSVYVRFPRVSDWSDSIVVLSRLRIHRNNRDYAFVLSLCRLAWQNLIPNTESDKSFRFVDFREDERQMGYLFEAFVRGFYRREQQEYRLARRRVDWWESAENETDVAFLPRMQTDVTLQSKGRMVILETKFYKDALAVRFGQDRVRSAHLYQLLTYMRNTAPVAQKGEKELEGILLYAAPGREFNFRYRLEGHNVTVRTLRLDQDWKQIHEDLIGMLR